MVSLNPGLLPNFMKSNECILFLAYNFRLKHLCRWPQGLLWNQSPKHKRILSAPFFLQGTHKSRSDKRSWWLNTMSWLPGELWFALHKALWAWLKTRICFVFVCLSLFCWRPWFKSWKDGVLLESSVGWGLCPWWGRLRGLHEMAIQPPWGTPRDGVSRGHLGKRFVYDASFNILIS